MKKRLGLGIAAICLGIVFSSSTGQAASTQRLGVGVNYWKTVKNLSDDFTKKGFDESGLSYLVSYQYVPIMFFRLEADLEIFPTDFTGGSNARYAPQGFVMTGIGPLYGGVGIGIYYGDGGWAAAPFYMAKAGLEFELLPQIFLDISANYRIDDWEKIRDIRENAKTDTVRLGAAVRLGF